MNSALVLLAMKLPEVASGVYFYRELPITRRFPPIGLGDKYSTRPLSKVARIVDTCQKEK